MFKAAAVKVSTLLKSPAFLVSAAVVLKLVAAGLLIKAVRARRKAE
jgi:hypothetical protein